MSGEPNKSAGGRPGFYFLLCPDAELSRRHLQTLLKKFPAAEGQWEKLVFWGDEQPDDRFWGSLNQGGLFASSRALIMRMAQEWPAAVWKELSRALGKKNEKVWPIIFLEGAWDKGKPKMPAFLAKSPCLEFAEKKGWIWKSQGLAPAFLARHVESEARKLGLKFESAALEIFCETAPPNALAIANELEKLALASDSGAISADMVSAESATAETDAFACIQKLENGDLPGAWKELAKGSASSLLFFLIALLSRELRTLWLLNLGQTPRMPPDVAARKKKLAQNMGFAGLTEGFSALADAEWSVKSGKLSPEQALDALALRASSFFGGKALRGNSPS